MIINQQQLKHHWGRKLLGGDGDGDEEANEGGEKETPGSMPNRASIAIILLSNVSW